MLTGRCLCEGVRYELDGELGPVVCGSLDQDPGARPMLQVWTSAKAPWFTITDDLPQLPSA